MQILLFPHWKSPQQQLQKQKGSIKFVIKNWDGKFVHQESELHEQEQDIHD